MKQNSDVYRGQVNINRRISRLLKTACGIVLLLVALAAVGCSTSEAVNPKIGNLLQTQVNDARIQMVSLTDVEVDPKVTRAHVYFSVLGGPEERDEALAGLQSAAGYLRRELGQRIRLRNTPQLIFHWDPSMERGERISNLLDQLHDESEGSEAES